MQNTITTSNRTAADVLEELHLKPEDVLYDAALLELRRRITMCQTEIACFTGKYKASYETIAGRQQANEDFRLADDLNDWRFALESLAKNQLLLSQLH
jgi:hypothetical protein